MNNAENNSVNPNDIVYKRSAWKRITSFPQFGIMLVFIGLFVVLAIAANTNFLNGNNLINVLRQGSAEMVVAVGMTFVLILGGIDLSVASVANLCGTICAGLMVEAGLDMGIAISLSILLGIGLGFINGIIIAKLKIMPFITTLAMMTSAMGVSLLYSGGLPINQLPESFTNIGRGTVAGIPVSVIIMIAVIVVAWIVLSKTVFGRRIYATGGNEEAARLSGIKVDQIKITVYCICGALAALTGIIYTARLASSQPTMAQGLELQAISAVCLGGTSLLGGRGYILGTIFGTMFLTVLRNGLNILNVSSYWQQLLTGIILVVAVVLYTQTTKKKS